MTRIGRNAFYSTKVVWAELDETDTNRLISLDMTYHNKFVCKVNILCIADFVIVYWNVKQQVMWNLEYVNRNGQR